MRKIKSMFGSALMTKRQFIRSGALSVTSLSSVLNFSLPSIVEPKYPFLTLSDAMTESSFDPRSPESFTAVFAADLHYGHFAPSFTRHLEDDMGDREHILSPMLREINAMQPLPKFFGIAGDLISRASLHFGQVPDQKQKEEAVEEFRILRDHLHCLDPRISVRLALGNHDTYPGEDEPALFHKVFSEHPEYHSFTIMGVHFIFLNGGSSGYIDPEQRDWFRDDVTQNHKPGATLVLVCHQPSLGSVTYERGIPETIREVLSDYDGELWMVAGHSHCNRDECFRLPQSVITQATITTGNQHTWGTEHPGYWIYGFTKGKLATRIFRKLGEGFSIASPAPVEKARNIPRPFGGHDEILWKVMVGEGDKPYLVDAKASWCLNYWHYNKYLIYRFPLSLADGTPHRFALLESPSGPDPQRYFV
ncbi:metallophosphoesterase family protein, partial [Candidatus Poribacteria bacterium]